MAATPPPPPPPRLPPVPPPPPARFRRDTTPDSGDRFKSIVAVLIGLVTVTGAFVTWRSVTLGNEADDADRQVILETVIQERNLVRVETQLASERAYFARYRAGLVNADLLEEAASTGAPVDIARRVGDAETARELADNLAFLTFSDVYVTGTAPSDLTFDETRRARDLARQDLEASQVNPDQTVQTANRLHERALRFVRFIVAFVGIVVLLTVAQLSPQWLRPFLAGIAFVAYVATTAVVFIGDKA